MKLKKPSRRPLPKPSQRSPWRRLLEPPPPPTHALERSGLSAAETARLLKSAPEELARSIGDALVRQFDSLRIGQHARGAAADLAGAFVRDALLGREGPARVADLGTPLGTLMFVCSFYDEHRRLQLWSHFCTADRIAECLPQTATLTSPEKLALKYGDQIDVVRRAYAEANAREAMDNGRWAIELLRFDVRWALSSPVCARMLADMQRLKQGRRGPEFKTAEHFLSVVFGKRQLSPGAKRGDWFDWERLDLDWLVRLGPSELAAVGGLVDAGEIVEAVRQRAPAKYRPLEENFAKRIGVQSLENATFAGQFANTNLGAHVLRWLDR